MTNNKLRQVAISSSHVDIYRQLLLKPHEDEKVKALWDDSVGRKSECDQGSLLASRSLPRTSLNKVRIVNYLHILAILSKKNKLPERLLLSFLGKTTI